MSENCCCVPGIACKPCTSRFADFTQSRLLCKDAHHDATQRVCAVCLFLSDVRGKITLLINIHIERVPTTLSSSGEYYSSIDRSSEADSKNDATPGHPRGNRRVMSWNVSAGKPRQSQAVKKNTDWPNTKAKK